MPRLNFGWVILQIVTYIDMTGHNHFTSLTNTKSNTGTHKRRFDAVKWQANV